MSAPSEPAFPCKSHEGLTLRDYFAAHAPVCPDAGFFPRSIVHGEAVVADGSRKRIIYTWPELEIHRQIRWSLEYAEAMLAARKGATA